MRDNVFATTFSVSDIWRMSVVNCPIKTRWRSYRGDAFFWFLKKGVYQRLMIRKKYEMMTHDVVMETLYSCISGQQLPVTSAVLLLTLVQLLGVKRQRFPVTFFKRCSTAPMAVSDESTYIDRYSSCLGCSNKATLASSSFVCSAWCLDNSCWRYKTPVKIYHT